MKRAQTGKAKIRTVNINKGAMRWNGWNITEELLNKTERQGRNPMQLLSVAACASSETCSDEEYDYYIEQEKTIRAAR